jgi:hypothetical protein
MAVMTALRTGRALTSSGTQEKINAEEQIWYEIHIRMFQAASGWNKSKMASKRAKYMETASICVLYGE